MAGGGRLLSWIFDKLILSDRSLWMVLFPHCTKFGAKILIDAEIMSQNRPSVILDFRKSDFCALWPYALPIFHLGVKCGAKMLFGAEIMAQNRNPRWRPSAILDFQKIWFLSTGTPRTADFPSLYQIWRKNVDRRWIYSPKSKSKMAAVRHLGFVTSSRQVFSLEHIGLQMLC